MGHINLPTMSIQPLRPHVAVTAHAADVLFAKFWSIQSVLEHFFLSSVELVTLIVLANYAFGKCTLDWYYCCKSKQYFFQVYYRVVIVRDHIFTPLYIFTTEPTGKLRVPYKLMDRIYGLLLIYTRRKKMNSSFTWSEQEKIMFTMMHLEMKVNSFKGVSTLQVRRPSSKERSWMISYLNSHDPFTLFRVQISFPEIRLYIPL